LQNVSDFFYLKPISAQALLDYDQLKEEAKQSEEN